MDEKIIQIMPAPNNLYAVYDDEGNKIKIRVICLALLNNGDVIMMDIDDTGYIDVTDARNFTGIEWA